MPRECLAKHPKVVSQLCDLNYPYRCGAQCMRQYQRWLKEEPEVQKLEGLEESSTAFGM